MGREYSRIQSEKYDGSLIVKIHGVCFVLVFFHLSEQDGWMSFACLFVSCHLLTFEMWLSAKYKFKTIFMHYCILWIHFIKATVLSLLYSSVIFYYISLTVKFFYSITLFQVCHRWYNHLNVWPNALLP